MSLNANALADEASAQSLIDAEFQVSTGRGRLIVKRFMRNKPATVGLVVVFLMFVVAFVGPHIDKWQYTDIDFQNFQTPPSATHWFGTTQTGQDVFAVTMRGMQKSLIIGLVAGVAHHGSRPWSARSPATSAAGPTASLSWGIDLLLVLPRFLISRSSRPGFKGRAGCCSCCCWPASVDGHLADRAEQTLSLRERESSWRPGSWACRWRIILRHILPNISSLLIIDATLNVSAAILGETALSFFGFGIQPPDVSLGSLIADRQQDRHLLPVAVLVFPTPACIVLLLAVNLVGDGLRDALDPTSTGARKKMSKSASRR